MAPLTGWLPGVFFKPVAVSLSALMPSAMILSASSSSCSDLTSGGVCSARPSGFVAPRRTALRNRSSNASPPPDPAPAQRELPATTHSLGQQPALPALFLDHPVFQPLACCRASLRGKCHPDTEFDAVWAWASILLTSHLSSIAPCPFHAFTTIDFTANAMACI